MQKAIAGLASSGTVTVQAAILGLPLISVYKVNAITYFLAKRLVDLEYFTMVNIISEKEVYREYLQKDVCPEILVPQIEKILPNGERRNEVISDLKIMVKLGEGTDIFANTAKIIAKCRFKLSWLKEFYEPEIANVFDSGSITSRKVKILLTGEKRKKYEPFTMPENERRRVLMNSTFTLLACFAKADFFIARREASYSTTSLKLN